MRLLQEKRKIFRSYSFLSIAANFLVALSVSGLSVLGVLSSEIALPIVITCAITFGILGLVGRFIDQSLDDTGDTDD